MAYNIYVYSDNQNLLSEIAFEARRNIAIDKLIIENSYDNAVNFFASSYVNIVIIDFNICDLRHFEFIDHVRRSNKDTYVISLIDMVNDELKKVLIKLSSVILIKPVNPMALISFIIKAIKISNSEYEKIVLSNEVEKEVTRILSVLDFKSSIRSYRFLKSAIMLIYNFGNSRYGMTTTIYPSIAKMFDTTSIRVERVLRHSINVSYQKYLKNSIDKNEISDLVFSRKKPTNSEFMLLVVGALPIKKNVLNILL